MPFDPFADLPAAAALIDAPTAAASEQSGWVAWIGYDYGRLLEPTGQSPQPSAPSTYRERRRPLAELHRVNNVHKVHKVQLDYPPQNPSSWTIGALQSCTGRDRYCAHVRQALELIAAGECYQINLAHRLTAEFQGSPRDFAAALLASAQPCFGAYIESPDAAGGIASAICSLSPELFLSFDPATRRIITRPMKGTRPLALAHELHSSEKDIAELTMIVDLMRNDLSRICEPGSVIVESRRSIERHHDSQDKGGSGGVAQGTATVAGIVRQDVNLADMLRATFPPGSVTGAPKIRVMRAIDELEQVRRGPYCGGIGWFGDDGRIILNVAIRTACLSFEAGATTAGGRGVLDYHVGAGIVADSQPQAEWEETMVKARVLTAMLAAAPRQAPLEAQP